MSRLILAASALALLAAAPLAAQPAAPATTVAPDPARATKARRLIQSFFPESSRAQMIGAMMDSVTASMRGSLAQNADIQALTASSPGAGRVYERFLDRQIAVAKQDMQDALPELLDAMAAAYARRFSAVQLDELAAFFETPTGRAYVRESMTILSDPDIARVQGAMMARSMERLPEAIGALIQELQSAPPPIPGT